VSRLPTTFEPGELPAAELHAMRLDGEIFALADAWCPIDVAETPEVRARAAMTGRSERLVAARRTAAWIWGVIPLLPRPLELCADVRARARLGPGTDAVVHEYVLGEHDVARLAGVAVTTPLRTLLDLARTGVDDIELLRGLADAGGVSVEAALGALEGRALPGRRAARAALERALSPR
jgi:hypothetical protein